MLLSEATFEDIRLDMEERPLEFGSILFIYPYKRMKEENKAGYIIHYNGSVEVLEQMVYQLSEKVKELKLQE